MSKVLCLFDVAPFVYAGMRNANSKLEQLVDVGSTFKMQVTPTGGLSLLLSEVYQLAGKADCVFCCDRNPTIKKDMFPEYKSGRKPNPNVSVSKAATEWLLDKCGFTTLARAGYEADDIIYTLVREHYDEYDEIYIYTGDSDLYFLVDSKVSIRPNSSRGKSVNINNYEEVLKSKGSRYNTLTMQKIIKGDSSDNIPALPKDLQNVLGTFFYSDESVMHQLGNKEFVLQWTDFIAPEAVPRVELIFPLTVDGLPTDFKQPDTDTIIMLGRAVRNKFYKDIPCKDTMLIDAWIHEMHELGYYLEEE